MSRHALLLPAVVIGLSLLPSCFLFEGALLCSNDDACPDFQPHCVEVKDGVGRCSSRAPEPSPDAGAPDAGAPDAGEPDGGAPDACAAGAPCTAPEECAGPCQGEPACFEASCTEAGCEYAVQADRVCVEAGCRDGALHAERLCGDDGACDGDAPTSCAGYACTDDSLACRTSCDDSSQCAPGHFCRTSDNTCLPLLDDGEDCSADGADGCSSGYCDGVRCCREGHCCNIAADCPALYRSEATCTDPSAATDCQGTRQDATCVDNVCSTVVIQDDSGCFGAAKACPDHLAAVACSDATDQPPPACPATCDEGPCEGGYQCEVGACVSLLGVGDACGAGLPECGSGLKCENGVCCDEASSTCCTAESEATACAGALRCDVDVFACLATCAPNTSDSCASPDDYCVDGLSCAPKKASGEACGHDNQCGSGSCVDGVCCESACAGTCEACSALLTGLADGTCGAIQSAEEPGKCDAQGTGCAGNACTCLAGTCKAQNGEVCTLDTACASGNCECSNVDCSEKRCNAASCATCSFADSSFGDALCTGNLDGTSCAGCGTGSCVCNGAGSCLRANNEICTSASECDSGFCECANNDCSEKRCGPVNCGHCQFDNDRNDASCEGTVTDYSRGECAGSSRCLSGTCVSPGTCSCSCDALGCELPPAQCLAFATGCTAGFRPSDNCSVGSCTCNTCSASGSCSCVPDI